jgi:hypothetical protein
MPEREWARRFLHALDHVPPSTLVQLVAGGETLVAVAHPSAAVFEVNEVTNLLGPPVALAPHENHPFRGRKAWRDSTPL